jgi:hypothetical protein
VARDCRFVIESPSAGSLAELLVMHGFDVEAEGTQVLGYADGRERAETLARRAAVVVRASEHAEDAGDPALECWDEELFLYVDADAPPPFEEHKRDPSDEEGWRASASRSSGSATVGTCCGS